MGQRSVHPGGNGYGAFFMWERGDVSRGHIDAKNEEI